MGAEDVTIEVGRNSYSGRLNAPNQTSERGIVVIPGAGHGPFENVHKVS
jgi:hypothetical protein